jgi:hypothetical protein
VTPIGQLPQHEVSFLPGAVIHLIQAAARWE